MIWVESTNTTSPLTRVMGTMPESRATWVSRPVPTRARSGRSKGTAWRCMFEPIRARLASSCSRKGINEAATEMTCTGESCT